MWRGIGAALGGWLVGDFWFVARFRRFLGEPVVHSTEWTTGSGLFLVFGPFPAFSEELVVHSTEWTTGAGPFLVFALFLAFSRELVVHSTEWTTGAGLSLVFGLFLAFSRGASGPLDRVDHWRGTLPRFRSVFGGCLEGFLAMAATYLRGFAGYYGDLFDRICRLADLATLFIYYIDK